jgi:hypothetical protein
VKSPYLAKSVSWPVALTIGLLLMVGTAFALPNPAGAEAFNLQQASLSLPEDIGFSGAVVPCGDGIPTMGTMTVSVDMPFHVSWLWNYSYAGNPQELPEHYECLEWKDAGLEPQSLVLKASPQEQLPNKEWSCECSDWDNDAWPLVDGMAPNEDWWEGKAHYFRWEWPNGHNIDTVSFGGKGCAETDERSLAFVLDVDAINDVDVICSGNILEDAVARAEPSVESAMVGGAQAGSPVTLYYKMLNSILDIWYFVQYTDFSSGELRTGWIRADLIEPPSSSTCIVRWLPTPDCLGGDFNRQNDTCDYVLNRARIKSYGEAFASCPNLAINPETGEEYFCTYRYAGYDTGCGEESDCANFVSQALYYGGMPMSMNWYCAGQPCGSTSQVSWTGAQQDEFPDYAQDLGGMTFKAPFQNLSEYISPYWWGWNVPWDEEHPNVAAIEAFAATMAGNTSKACSEREDGIVAGDIVYVANVGAEKHVMLVQGWGPMAYTWSDVFSYGHDYLADCYSYPNNVVPYLVDHGPHGGVEAGTRRLLCPQCTEPRPYYALYWQYEGLLKGLTAVDNPMTFVHIPNVVQIPIPDMRQSPFDPGEIPLHCPSGD